jgi:filamentous hemagglutinin
MTIDNRRELSGAPGGWWEAFEEHESAEVIRQCTPNACGPACAEMLFRARGIFSVSQQEVISVQGSNWSNEESLSAAMNQIGARIGIRDSGRWLGAWVDSLDGAEDSFNYLLKSLPYITSLKSFNSESHMVVVDGLDDEGRVVIRDPYEGTTYIMSRHAFCDVWQGMTIWWSGEYGHENP